MCGGGRKGIVRACVLRACACTRAMAAMCGPVGLPTAESGYRDHSHHRGSESSWLPMADGRPQLKFTVLQARLSVLFAGEYPRPDARFAGISGGRRTEGRNRIFRAYRSARACEKCKEADVTVCGRVGIKSAAGRMREREMERRMENALLPPRDKNRGGFASSRFNAAANRERMLSRA